MTNTREERVARALFDIEWAKSPPDLREQAWASLGHDGYWLESARAAIAAYEVEPSPDVWEAPQDTGASATPSGSHPSGHAASGVDDALRFDPSRDWLAAPETDAALAELDGSDIALFARAAKVIRQMRAEHRRLHWRSIIKGGQVLEVADALSFDSRPQVGEDWPNYTHRIRQSIDRAKAIAMEAREGGNAEERSHAKHDSAGPQGHRPPTGQVTVEEDRA